MPSAYESWGMTAREAMAAGIPVIANPGTGLKENCGLAAIWCDRDKPNQWVKEINRLHDKIEYQKQSDIVREYAKTNDTSKQLPDFESFLINFVSNETQAKEKHQHNFAV